MTRQLRELDRLDATYGVGALPSQQPKRDWRLGVAMIVGLGGVIGLLGWGSFHQNHNDGAPPVSDGDGSFKFAYTARDGVTPVGWNPCKPIRVEINPEGAPDGGERMVRTAMEHVTEASGLQFELVGTTDSRRFLDDRGGFGRVPAIVGWSDEDEYDELKGDVAGVGGPTYLEMNGFRQFISGAIVLDIDAFDEIFDAGLEDEAQAIVDHEFGHLVGLDHADSRGELMYAENTGRTTWGPGDREALARLGNIRCR
jgi:hypothetical protein